MNENFIDLDFYHGLPSHSFVDKKSEVRVNIGRTSTVPKSYVHYTEKYGGVLMGIQQSGMDADKLDRMCSLLGLNCRSLGIELLITKSDRPFDSQWYFFGDIEGLLKAAQDELVRPPFTRTVHEQITSAMRIILKR
jgi:hypothetical protein